ncbi:MAG: efflux RND transporter periplasmic adaptor subunit [Gammaproteobacteria bacterium]|nr:efflux RND transporter periplasmic adaptor subunit [Gammaproteobacteria bacterium]
MRMTRAVAATVLLGVWTLAHGQELQLPFETAIVSTETVIHEEKFDALVEAVNQSTVSAQTSGRIVEVNVDVDDYVEEGSVILRMRSAEQRAGVSAAEARAREAKAEFDRVKDLVAKQLLAKSAFDKAEADLKAANAALAQAREGLGYTVVRAPYSGFVVERHIEVGETASPGQPLMTGISLDALRATASVPQVHIATVRSLSRARVVLSNGERIEGGRVTISPFADAQSHTFKVRVDLPEGGHEDVYPGMFAKVAFATGEAQVLLVPAAAVVHRSEVTAVYVIDAQGNVRFRQIRTGAVHGDKVEVLAGLSTGERVALDPIRAGVYLKEQRAGNRP